MTSIDLFNSIQIMCDAIKRQMQMIGLNDTPDQSDSACGAMVLQFPAHNFSSYLPFLSDTKWNKKLFYLTLSYLSSP